MVGITYGSDVFDYRRPVTDFCDRVEHEKRATMLDGESGPPTMVESVTIFPRKLYDRVHGGK